MKTNSGRALRGWPVHIVTLLLLADSATAQVVNSGMFTQNRLRQCSTPTACIGGDPTLQLEAQFDAGTSGEVSTLVSDSALGAQAATSGGYTGPAFIPALSAYAYTSGPQRYTLSSIGYQKYTLDDGGTVTFDATLTYSKSGQTAPTSENPRGLLLGSIIKWEFDGDEFDPHACNFFSNLNAVNAAGFLITCITRNGQPLFPGGPVISFPGLRDVEVAEFNLPAGPVSNGVATAQLTVTGQAGDVFFIGSTIGALVHLGGFADSRNTLLMEVDQPELVQATFDEDTFSPAPATSVDIDVKPGSDPNCLNINGHGKIPVAVLGNDAFDVLDVDQVTLTFDRLAVATKRMTVPMCNPEYSDGDEYLDLVCHFEDSDGDWSPDSDDQASVEGNLNDGRPFSGVDDICLVP